MSTRKSLVLHGLALGLLYFGALPMMPNIGIGPFEAINPHAVFKLTLIILAIIYISHVLMASAHHYHAFLLSGFLGGFSSSTATVLAMAHLSKEQPSITDNAASAAVASNVATYIQMAVLIWLISPTLLASLAIPFLVGATVATAMALLVHQKVGQMPALELGDISLLASIKKTLFILLLISTMLVLIAYAKHSFGHQGVNLAAFFSGLVDGHASAISIAELVAKGVMPLHNAGVPVLIGLTSNTLVRAALSSVSRSKRFTLTVAGTLLSAVLLTWLTFFAIHGH